MQVQIKLYAELGNGCCCEKELLILSFLSSYDDAGQGTAPAVVHVSCSVAGYAML